MQHLQPPSFRTRARFHLDARARLGNAGKRGVQLVACLITSVALGACMLERTPIAFDSLPAGGSGGGSGIPPRDSGQVAAGSDGGSAGHEPDAGRMDAPDASSVEVDARVPQSDGSVPADAASEDASQPTDAGLDAAADAGDAPDPDAGHPDAGGGSKPDAGGGSNPDAGGGSDPDAGGPGWPDVRISCGSNLSCQAPDSYCCVDEIPGWPDSIPSDAYSCQSAPEPTASSCDQTFTCRRHADCGTGQCCGRVVNGSTHFACSDSCESPDVEVACRVPSDCAEGYCCGALNPATNNGDYLRITCRSSCSGTNDRRLCASDADCPSGTPRTVFCRSSTVLGGVRTCRGPGQ
jgi:hypothetical protein